jgi:hypothetical protein
MTDNIEPFNCSLCGILLTDYCVNCSAFYRGEQPIKPTRTDLMSGDDRAIEMEKLGGKLSIPFDLVHVRIEQLVGRGVYTHEMGLNWKGLVEESRERNHPTIEQIIDLIPAEKRIIIISEGDK